MSQKILVDCPHCGHQQKESPAAISTVCRGCKQYFSLEYKPGTGRRLRKQRPSRLVRCSSCNSEQKVFEDALSAVCGSCGAHLTIGNYALEGVVRQRLSTSGNIVFGPSVRYSGPEVRGQNITIGGRIKARLRAVEEIVFARKSEVKGSVIAPLIRVLRGADAVVDRVQTRLFQAEGDLKAKQIFAREKIEIGKEGRVEGVALITREIVVEPGGALSGRLDTTAVPISDEDGENDGEEAVAET